MSDHFDADDYRHTATLLRESVEAGRDSSVSAIMSNNFNIILGALDVAGNCCHAAPRPGIGLGNANVFPEQMVVLDSIAEGLSYKTPLDKLILKMRHMGSCGDTRPRWGDSIARCLLHNGADRLELISRNIDIRPWSTLRERLRDAWAVVRQRACALYVSGSVYDRKAVLAKLNEEQREERK